MEGGVFGTCMFGELIVLEYVFSSMVMSLLLRGGIDSDCTRAGFPGVTAFLVVDVGWVTVELPSFTLIKFVTAPLNIFSEFILILVLMGFFF